MAETSPVNNVSPPSAEPASVTHASANDSDPTPGEVEQQQIDFSLRERWLTLADQHVVAIVCCLLLAWASFRWIELSRWGSEPIEILRLPEQQYAYVVDPNDANWIELSLLEGLGETLAKRIIENREAEGPFSQPKDLLRVRGIGEKTLARFSAQLRFEQQSSSEFGQAQEKTP